MTEAIDNAERGYTITRTFDAPRELVWKAWTEPEQFAQWFGGEDSRLENVEMDAREGGSWHATMIIEGGQVIEWAGNFPEVAPPDRLVMAFTDQGVLGGEFELFTVTLTEIEGKTQMVLRQSGGHLSDEEYGFAKKGTASFIDRMEALLARTMKPRH
jgi:uncharacterized protein YndB with AHSA1/START domain